MSLLHNLKNISENCLESPEGCNYKVYDSIVALLRYFNYDRLADAVCLNSICENGKYKCGKGVVAEIFKEYR